MTIESDFKKPLESTASPTLAAIVVPAAIVAHAVELLGGQQVAVSLKEPSPVHAVILTDGQHRLEVMSLHATEAAAIARCREIIDAPEGGVADKDRRTMQ